MSQTISNKENTNLNHKKQVEKELTSFYVFGLPLLKLMLLLVAIGLLIIGVYEFCSGGTAG